jgi:hypothetical protein
LSHDHILYDLIFIVQVNAPPITYTLTSVPSTTIVDGNNNIIITASTNVFIIGGTGTNIIDIVTPAEVDGVLPTGDGTIVVNGDVYHQPTTVQSIG